ncbi:MAG: hypothetical protein H7177_01170 [Rhizobacter sp.]|nr:hypothetical protein [Bacteriovorax sp.]
MKKIIFFTLMSLCSMAFSSELTYHPVGLFSYNNEVTLTKKRSAETVSLVTAEGAARIKDLKNSGYICIRKNAQTSLCTKTENNLPTPDFIQAAVDKYLIGVTFTFPGTGVPTVVFDGANTEWMVTEVVMLGKIRVPMYKITKTFDGPWYVTFPVSDEQGIGTLNLVNNDELGLPLTMEQKVNGQTIGYFITATLKK